MRISVAVQLPRIRNAPRASEPVSKPFSKPFSNGVRDSLIKPKWVYNKSLAPAIEKCVLYLFLYYFPEAIVIGCREV